MKLNKKVISIFSTAWGHKSLGEAAEDALKSNFNTYLNFIKPEKLGANSYKVIYQLFPYFSKIPYKISENDYVSKTLKKYLYKSYVKKIEKYIKVQKPDFVISVYFAFTLVLEKLAKKYGFKLINVVSDPRTIHKLLLSESSYNLVFDNKSVHRCKDLGVDPKLCIQSGWFVRSEFKKPVSKKNTKLLLGLNPKIFTICVIGGSDGALNMLKILPVFMANKKKLQIIFICGNNKKLYDSLYAFFSILDIKKHRNTKFVIKGFIKDTHKYLQASDLIIGKAGPNLLFESVAVQTPFLAITHISGQEDGNLEIIKEYNLGLVEENPIKAIELTKNIINDPKLLDRYSKNLELMSKFNSNSNNIIKQLIEKND